MVALLFQRQSNSLNELSTFKEKNRNVKLPARFFSAITITDNEQHDTLLLFFELYLLVYLVFYYFYTVQNGIKK